IREKKNVKPEVGWSQLRRRFTPGFEDILDVGVNMGWYDPKVLLEALTFRWVFIPWLQSELDSYCHRVNNTAKCHDRNKILPNGVPAHMFQFPEDYAALDFKVGFFFALTLFETCTYAPQDHDVFQLVPADFNLIITQIYTDAGQPTVDRQSYWDVYLTLLRRLEIHLLGGPVDIEAQWGFTMQDKVNGANELELLQGLEELRGGESAAGQYYMGGVNNGDG
ncbi:hypothetical protein FB45DRAFT_691567, partial [Roridomyces roridus]